MSVCIISPHDMELELAELVRARRLAMNFSQKSLAERSGVSFGVLKKFERTGKISLTSLLKLALVLEALAEFKNLFNPMPAENFLSLDELLKDKTRKRGRQ